MFKHCGMTTVELLIGLTITSSATYVTLEMAEEAEVRIAEYQEATDVKKIMQKLRGGHPNSIAQANIQENPKEVD